MEEARRGVNERQHLANGQWAGFDQGVVAVVKDTRMARPARARGRRLGQRIGIVLFAACVSIPTLVWTQQIMRALFFPPEGPAPSSCGTGQLALLRALERARAAARAEDPDERQSMARFREALAPEWSSRPALDALCRANPADGERLRAIDALRYAEEHAVRYEASALAGQRQRARKLEQELEQK
jgi:hypothetical protein